MFGFEKFSVSAWTESGLTTQPKHIQETKPKRRSGSWKIVASVLMATATATSTLAMAGGNAQGGTAEDLQLLRSADATQATGARRMVSLLTNEWHASASDLLKAGIAPTMSDDVRALALQVISDQKNDEHDDIDAWARSLVEGMFS
ncbi:hypothetical protein EVC45_10425 [Paraburkholderia sp. UYCP14C]|uniref:hypothetical protein n=1 Tax=Paraburkholderia sp. UYCP14C TaxID=2511130 RepID=UPI00102274CF|nr:hypothetical protein [Paraburkholderia sp. UYCP14C]RZF30000.1 hypothetical protein EVC45_10425 [Paraburkholderia sp. UYCP14C]